MAEQMATVAELVAEAKRRGLKLPDEINQKLQTPSQDAEAMRVIDQVAPKQGGIMGGIQGALGGILQAQGITPPAQKNDELRNTLIKALGDRKFKALFPEELSELEKQDKESLIKRRDILNRLGVVETQGGQLIKVGDVLKAHDQGVTVGDSSSAVTNLTPEQLSPQQKATLDKTTSEANLKDMQAKALKEFSEGMSKNVIEQSGLPEEDFQQEPAQVTFMGVPQTIMVPKLKPAPEAKDVRDIVSFRSTVKNIQNNLGLMTPEVKSYMDPMNPLASRNSIADFLLKVQSNDSEAATQFKVFKAETDKLFQQFRKETTGAQAALKELGWLTPDFPEANDPPALYLAKSKEAMKRINEGEQLLIDALSQAGKRVSEIKSQSGMTQSSGQLSGILDDLL